jgi:hypothetical protein
MYKIKVYLNRPAVDLTKDFEKVRVYFAKRNIPLQFTFEKSDIKNLEFYKENMPQGERILLKSRHNELDTSSEINIFVFNQEEFRAPNIPTGRCFEIQDRVFIETGTHKLNPENYHFVEICHELMHAFVYIANRKGFKVADVMDTYWNNYYPELPNSNFGNQFMLLQKFIDSHKEGYKYFKEDEIVGLKPELVKMLDEARDIAGIPFVITSGLRTSEKNESVGGVDNSSHTKGLGVDLRCNNSANRYTMVRSLMAVGFNRIGVYKAHIHADCDKTLPQNVIWVL